MYSERSPAPPVSESTTRLCPFKGLSPSVELFDDVHSLQTPALLFLKSFLSGNGFAGDRVVSRKPIERTVHTDVLLRSRDFQ